ncbi:MAG: tRNA (guanosine(46)-N7)-methyltransferase TrmB [Pseudomonadota bacterium]
MSQDNRQPRTRLLYGRQQGHKLRARQRELLDTLLPQLAIELPETGTLDPQSLYEDRPASVFLEIGFGGGEHLAARAAEHPDRGYLGAEPFVNGMAKILSAIDDQKLKNIRLHHGDAREVLDCLPDASISGLFLLYPDPWPKKRHNKRRFVNPDNIRAFHRILKPGAEFLFASDITDYVRWTLAHMAQHGGFAWTAERPGDWRTPPEGWPGTRYEAKALREGRTAHYLTFRKS